MPPAFSTPDDAFSHPSGDLGLPSFENSSLDEVLLGYAQKLDCTLSLTGLWDAIDAQLDVDSQAHQPQQDTLQANDLARDLASDETNTLWDTYADSPECLEPETCQQLESMLPHWPQAQHAIGER